MSSISSKDKEIEKKLFPQSSQDEQIIRKALDKTINIVKRYYGPMIKCETESDRQIWLISFQEVLHYLLDKDE